MPGVMPPLRPVDLLAQWQVQPLITVALAVVVALYVRGRRALPAGSVWAPARDVVFAAGVISAFWVTSGFLEVRGRQLMWVWTIQQLALLLIVPVALMAAQPWALAAAGRTGRRATGPARLVRALGAPVLGMLYVPIVTGLLFFGGVAGWSLRSALVRQALQLALLGIGAVIARPLVDQDDQRSSVAVGLALAVGVVELLLDAVPGIVLRLETHLVVPEFAVGRPPWSPSWLADQQTAGAILWTLAELLDLPFLLLVFRQWLRVERREAREVDAELDRLETLGPAADTAAAGGSAPGSRPWWLDDPQLRRRYGGS